MGWQGWDGRILSLEQLKDHVEALPFTGFVPRVQFVTLHNTGAPDKDKLLGETPAKRMASWLNYYRNELGWQGAPNIFVFPQLVFGLGTPLTAQSTHSPGFNGRSWSIEMGANFTGTDDDDDAGVGLALKNYACQAMALLLDKRGFVPVYSKTWNLHKDDKRTEHDCPGRDIEWPDIQKRVQAYYNDLNDAGDHGDLPIVVPPAQAIVSAPKPLTPERIVVAAVEPSDTLNMRDVSGLKGVIKGRVPRGTKLVVLNEAKNGETTWLRVRTPMGYIGWVSAKYTALPAITQPEQQQVPAPTPPIPVVPDLTTQPDPIPIEQPKPSDVLEPGLPVIKDNNDAAMAFLTGLPWADYPTLKSYGYEVYSPIQAAGLVGNLMRESFARMDTSARGDKINGVFTAYGIGQWRDERERALFALAKKLNLEPDTLLMQLIHAVDELQTDDDTDEVYAGKLLRAAKTVEEATAAGVVYERPRGWKRPLKDGKTTYDFELILPAARKGDGYQIRLDNAKQMLKEYETIKGKAA